MSRSFGSTPVVTVTGTPRDDGRRARCGCCRPYGANGVSVLGVSSGDRRASAPTSLARATGELGSRASVYAGRARREGRRRGTARAERSRSAGFGSQVAVERFGFPRSGRWIPPGFGSGGDVGGDEGALTHTVISRVSGGDIASTSVLSGLPFPKAHVDSPVEGPGYRRAAHHRVQTWRVRPRRLCPRCEVARVMRRESSPVATPAICSGR